MGNMGHTGHHDDRELLQLARMALEAEDLEGGEGAHAPIRFPGAAPSHVRAFRMAGGLIAAAAVLATSVVMMVPREPREAPTVADADIGTSRIEFVDETVPQPERCMLLAVYRTPDGSCRGIESTSEYSTATG